MNYGALLIANGRGVQMDIERIVAPFSDEEVEALRAHQKDKSLHPYTCNGCEPAKPLSIVKGGMVCWWCGYVQKWAHK